VPTDDLDRSRVDNLPWTQSRFPLSSDSCVEFRAVPDLISKKTRQEFREYFVSTTLRVIADEFDAADAPCDSAYDSPVSGQRRGLVEQYYHSVDWTKWSDVKRILAVFENVLSSLESRATGRDSLYADQASKEWALNKFNALKKWIERDGYRYESGRLIPVGRSLDLSEFSTTATRFDIPELQRQIDRMRGAIEDDPGLAIGTAKPARRS
jgi:hypothetical protein